MKASETNLQPIIEGTKQYVVPLFQRVYSWNEKQWRTLWDDLLDLCEGDGAHKHFIGSIVTSLTDSAPQGISKFLLIDGQQRMTTLFILLAVLRDEARNSADERLAQEIEETLLTNRFKDGEEFWKLLPTQADRGTFVSLLQTDAPMQQNLISEAFEFFKKRLRSTPEVGVKMLKKAITSDLILVSIELERDDNPHLIFESLNAKGTPLSQADLIRNFFFMKLGIDKQEQLYETKWEPMRKQLGDALTEYIRHFLMKDGTPVKQGEVYFALKERADIKSEQEIIDYLNELSTFASYYVKLLRPEEETSHSLRKRIERLKRIKITVAYPFLLNVYDDYANARIREEDFAAIMDTLENFMIRRFVCSVPTNQLNKIFPFLYEQAVEYVSLADGVREVLRTKNYPRDPQFRERFISSQLYGSGDRGERTKLILERLESSFGNKEAVSFGNLTVEHIMPQTLTDWWKQHLGGEFESIHEQYLHTVGNLTLTGYNPELSNADFIYKRHIFKESHLDLNDWFEDLEEWNEEAILARAEMLAERALSVWSYFGPSGEASVAPQTVTGTIPSEVVIMGDRVQVSSWREVAQTTLEMIAAIDEESFDEVVNRFPRFVSRTGETLRDPRKLSDGSFMESNLNASAINRFCIQAVEVAGLSPEDWFVETLQGK